MESIWQDVRYGMRMLGRHAGFTAVAVLTLALGIGANTAIFSVVHAVVLKPLPFPEPDRLVVIHNDSNGKTIGPHSSSWPDFEDIGAERDTFESVALFAYWTFNLTGRDVPERIVGGRVTGEFFPALGAKPLLGRTLTPEDDQPGAPDTLVISHGLWRGTFGGDPNIIGQTLAMNGIHQIVVGVMPPEFRFPAEDVQVWGAMKDNMSGMQRNSRFMFVFGRLRANVTHAEAAAALQGLSARLQKDYPDSNKGYSARPVSAHETLVGDVRTPLLVLLCAVGFVLLIACTNVGNLLLSRASARARESALRAALGAGRGRLLRQFLVENILLSLAGGLFGTAIGWLGLRALLGLHPGGVPRLDRVELDLSVLAFTTALSLSTGLVLGLIPALQAWRTDLRQTLEEGGRSDASGSSRLRDLLTAAEVALALILLVGAGLLLRSFAALTSVEAGFQTDRILTMNVFLTPPKYRQIPQRLDYVERGMQNLASLPGMESVAVVSDPPLGEGWMSMSVHEEGRPVTVAEAPLVGFRAISPSYLETLRIPLLRGRALAETDREETPRVLLINETMAKRLWPGEDPIGRRIRWADPQRDVGPMEIVGVVRDTRHRGLHQDEGPIVYAPLRQITFFWLRWFTFAARSATDGLAQTSAARGALLDIDRDQPVFKVQTLDQALDASLAERRFQMLLLQMFSGVALLLAAVGIYGVISYSVRQRTREIGLRMALGAQRGQVYRLILGGGLRWTLAGVILGIAGALGLSRYLSTLLFGIEPTDPPTFAMVTAVLLAVALVAAFIPARRAARIDPMAALRHD